MPEAEITVSCASIPEAAVLAAIDNCSVSTDLEVKFTEDITGQEDECATEYTITRSWEVSDCAGNTTNHTQVITVEDKEAPVFVGELPEAELTVSCAEVPTTVVLAATDNCSISTDLEVKFTEDITDQEDECATEYTITRSWEVSDCAGNTTNHTQVITVEDKEAPVFVGELPEAELTVSCAEVPTTAVLAATDNCSISTDLEVNYTENITREEESCATEYTITRNWEVSDCAGNTTNHTQVITVEDKEAPVFVGELPEAELTVSCAEVPTTAVLAATDNCSISTDLEVNYTENITREEESCATEYTITRNWEVSDCAGNTAKHTQIIKVEDNEAPTLVSSLEDINVECDVVPEAPTLEFTDNCSENVTQISFEEESTFDGTDSDYQIIRTWTVSDDCGNIGTFVQNINVTVKTLVTELSDAKCTDDGIIDLNDYLTEGISTDGEWVVTTDSVSLLTDATFDPLNIALGDYEFTYTVSGEGCLSSIKVTININDDCIVLPCGQEDVKISKAVTPNGDSWNEFFEVTGVESCGFITNVKIFNRWGARVYESNNYANNWNGISEGTTFGKREKITSRNLLLHRSIRK